MSGGLRELGVDLIADGQWERGLAVFAESVRRTPNDHRARMLAARCYEKLGETERAVTVLHACAEGLLRRDYLLSALAASKLALALSPHERRLNDTLDRVYQRAARTAAGRAAVPPPLPPEPLFDGKVVEDLMAMSGSELSDKAIEVLAVPELSAGADPSTRPPLPLFSSARSRCLRRLGEVNGLPHLRRRRATRKTATAFIDRTQFLELLKSYPTIRSYLEGLSERRLKMIGEALRPAEILDADELVMEPSSR